MAVKKIIALYLRISKRDEDKDEELESNSIGNQRGILTEFVKRNLDCSGYEVREFIDDGFSGTSMDRPAMNELLSLAKQGIVTTIIVKDLSRFARNYIELGNYTERIFPYIGVRFISINDNYDSDTIANKMPGIDMAFKGIIHDYYCKEMSKKMKAALRQQVEKGRCIVSKAPYGYWKSKEQKGVLVIDEETAPIVKRIFGMYASGISSYKITQYLNQNGIDSPNRRMEKAGLIKFKEDYSKGLCWTCGVVLGILRNQVYVGDLIGNKTERIKVCGKKSKNIDRDKWIVVKNTHEAIIDRDTFEYVGRLLALKKQPENIRKCRYHTFKGVLVCSRCNAVMTKSGENKGIAYYSCGKCKAMGQDGINIHSDFLEKEVRKRLSKHKEYNLANDTCEEVPLTTIGKQQKKPEKKTTIDLTGLYEKYAEGLISKEEFARQRELAQEQKELAALPVPTKQTEIPKAVDSLTEEVIHQYINRIIVYKNDKIQIEWLDEVLNKAR